MNRKALWVSTVGIALAALLVVAFIQGRAELANEQQREAPVKTPSRVSVASGEAVVTIDMATQAKSDLLVSALKSNTQPLEQQAYAQVLPVQDLADMRSSYATARAQLEKAQANLDVAREDYQRLTALHNDDRNVSDKVLQAGAAALKIEKANVYAAQTTVQSTASSVIQRYGDTITGWVVNDTSALKRVLQLQDVLIQVTFSVNTSHPAPPQTVRVQTAEQAFVTANLVARSPRLDPRIQGIGYIYIARAQTLLPGMNVLAFLPVENTAGGVVVPQSAVVWWQGKAWIYLQKNGDRFTRQEISTDQPIENGFVVRSRLQANDHIVTHGAQLLLSEEFRSQIEVGEEGASK
jgi:hypothetical protein